MERRFLIPTMIILIIGFMLICLLFLFGIGSARTITVDDDGEADHTNITDAVNSAEARAGSSCGEAGAATARCGFALARPARQAYLPRPANRR